MGFLHPVTALSLNQFLGGTCLERPIEEPQKKKVCTSYHGSVMVVGGNYSFFATGC